MVEYPCKDCKNRYLGCHDYCPQYQVAKDINVSERKKIQQKVWEENMNSTAKIENIKRFRRIRTSDISAVKCHKK